MTPSRPAADHSDDEADSLAWVQALGTPQLTSSVASCRWLIGWLIGLHPGRLFWITLGQLASTLLENIGLVLLIPLFALVVDGGADRTGVPGGDGLDGHVAFFVDMFGYLGLEMTMPNVLLTMIVAIWGKATIFVLVGHHRQLLALELVNRLRFTLTRSLFRAQWAYFGRLNSGDLGNIISGEVLRTQKAIAAVVQFIGRIASVLVYVWFGFSLSWEAAGAIGLVFVLSFLVARPLMRLTFGAGGSHSTNMKQLGMALADTLLVLKALKAMNREQRSLDFLFTKSLAVMHAHIRHNIGALLLTASQEPIGIVVLAGILYFGLNFFHIPVAVLAVMTLITIRTTTELWAMQKTVQAIGANAGSIQAVIGAILEAHAAEETQRSGGVHIQGRPQIGFREVDLAYEQQPLLSGVSFDLPSPGLTVVTGPSGSGKSTLIDGILGFKAVERGAVCIDGHAIDTLDLAIWRRQIGYLPQEVFLIEDSLRINLTLGMPIDDDDLMKALDRAGIGDFVRDQAEGLDLPIHSRGTNLSGGQRQRVALARSLVTGCSVLILDEATSALDAASRDKVHATLRTMAAELVVIAISHDPSLIALADRVVQVENGTAIMS